MNIHTITLAVTQKWSAFASALPTLVLTGIILASQCSAESLFTGKDKEILVVDINSELLFALGEYHELTVAEAQQSVFVQDRLVPVIERIISGFQKEHQNCITLAEHAGKPLGVILTDKINTHIATFESELKVRKKALEFELLRRKQRQMLLETGQ